MTIPVYGYIRQSVTRDGSESIAIQQDVIERAAPMLGVEVVRWFIEPPSTSGYKNRGRNRAKFAEMLAALPSGEAKGIVVYKSERLSRGGGPGWAPVFDAIEKAGLDTDRAVATATGWMSEFEIGIRATMDREESKKLSGRMIDVRAREAKAGKPRSGGRRPYGFETDLVTHRPAEAALIREAAERVLLGETPWNVARSWNEKGIRTGEGAHWKSLTLKRILISPRTAGLREHLGTTTPAVWAPIIDHETWLRVCVLVVKNAKSAGRPAGIRARTAMLSGFLYCGRCGGRLSARRRDKVRREYICPTRESSGSNTCGALVIHADAVEADVFDVVLGTVTDPVAVARLTAAAPRPGSKPGPDLGAEVRVLEDRKAKLLDIYLSGGVAKADYLSRLGDLEEELAQVSAELAERAGRPVLAGVPTNEAELRKAWDTRGIEWQRLVLDAIIKRITVAPGRSARVADRLIGGYELR